jgi:transposase
MTLIAFSYDSKFAIQGTQPGETVDSERYQKFIQFAADKFRRERRNSLRQGDIIWRQDNARRHVSKCTLAFFTSKGIQLSKQAPYSPDLNGCDRWLNKLLKVALKSMSFDTLEDLLTAARQVLGGVTEEQLLLHMNNFFHHCEHVIETAGDYTIQ